MSKTLEEELGALEQRRAELTADVEKAQGALTVARGALADGKGKAAPVAEAQAHLAAVTGALETVNQRIAAKAGEIAQARTDADRAAKLGQLAAIANETAAHMREYLGAKREALATLDDAVSRMTNAFTAVVAGRQRFVQVAAGSGLAPRVHGSPYALQPAEATAVHAMLEGLGALGADLDAVRVQWQGTAPSAFDGNSRHDIGVGSNWDRDGELSAGDVGEQVAEAFRKALVRQRARRQTISHAPALPSDETMVKW
jgi:hypothetical protein